MSVTYGVKVQRAGAFIVLLIFKRNGEDEEELPVTSFYGRDLRETMSKIPDNMILKLTHVILDDDTWEAPDELSVEEALEAHYGLVLFSKEEKD
jgi:hypothetical protein